MKHAREDYNRIQDPAGLIPEDEPVFLLRAQDKIAWHLVKMYAYCAELAGASPELVRCVRDHARRMKEWPIKKVPDLAAKDSAPAPTKNPNWVDPDDCEEFP